VQIIAYNLAESRLLHLNNALFFKFLPDLRSQAQEVTVYLFVALSSELFAVWVVDRDGTSSVLYWATSLGDIQNRRLYDEQ